MTGYGFSSKNNNNYSIEVETKSLNSKYFDLNLKSNFEIGKIENEIRNYVKRKLIRGKMTRKPNFKKAIVTLKKGQSIDLSTGI